VASALDRQRKPTLVPGTQTGGTPWLDLASFRDVPLEHVGSLVVDAQVLVLAEQAYPAARRATIPSASLALSITGGAIAPRSRCRLLLSFCIVSQDNLLGK